MTQAELLEILRKKMGGGALYEFDELRKCAQDVYPFASSQVLETLIMMIKGDEVCLEAVIYPEHGIYMIKFRQNR